MLFPGVFVLFVGFLIILYLAMSSEKRVAQSSSIVFLAIMVSQFVGVCQLLGILHSLTVPWSEPFLSLLSVAQIFLFHVDVLQANCAIDMTPTKSYSSMLIGLLIGLVTIVVTHCVLLRERGQFR